MNITSVTGKLLVANRGEIAIRICRAAADLGLETVAIYPADDASSLHTRKADTAVELPGRGVAAYLDGDAIIAAAKASGATMVHPGYGFLSENAAFARACEAAGLIFVGPTAEQLSMFGDKHSARELARAHDVPTPPGTPAPTTLEEAEAFFKTLGPGAAVMVKAVAGGGGRGMRPVHEIADLPEAFERCRSEAEKAFGDGALYVEALVERARHIEVQIIGDGETVSHLWERDCSLQRRRQKVVEIAPAPDLDPAVRERVIEASLRLAGGVGYRNLGTFEYLVDAESGAFFFLEANPRLQVEHTVTEEVTGLNLVELQLMLASGATLTQLGLDRAHVPTPRGMAMQLRLSVETISPEGEVRPGGGTISAYEAPSGRGVRVDGYGYVGYRSNPAYDALLAKLIVHIGLGGLPEIVAKAYRALCEFRIEGVPTNAEFLKTLLRDEAVSRAPVTTRYLEDNAARFAAPAEAPHPRYFFESTGEARDRRGRSGGAGSRLDSADPLAVLDYGRAQRGGDAGAEKREAAEGEIAVAAPLHGTIVSFSVAPGDAVGKGAQLAIVDAMKMEHVVVAESAGVVQDILFEPGDPVGEGEPMMLLTASESGEAAAVVEEKVDLDRIRPDLAEVMARRAGGTDAERPKAVVRRRKTGQRTARENVEDLVDEGSFVEYGPLVVAAQRSRRSLEDLLTRSPGDGLVTGVGSVNGDSFGDPDARVAVMAYDYTVFAGTQGVHNHWKTDRILGVAENGRMPLVLFGEGGGGRPGDADYGGFIGTNTFHHFGRLSGLVPMVGIVSGRCFAGNAALMGCCDVIIATENTNLGMGGPAMIEGGGLGVFAPEEVGPTADQVPNGVIDVLVENEAEGVAVAKQYLSYFQGRVTEWSAPDQRVMRTIVPENRLRAYPVRRVIETLADTGSMLELRRGFGRAMVTAFIRIEGRPVGVVSNDPAHLGGAIDSDGADKAVRFMQLCDAFDIPVLNLCDTPGIMVGPEAERTGLVRHAARMFVAGPNLSVPYFTVVLRKAYGLGAIAMAGGNFRAPYYTVSWPTGEFGPMGLEGQVKLGYRAELEAIEDPEKRKAFYEELVAKSYEEGKALARATTFAIDDTIDPAETRHWLATLLASVRPPAPRDGKKRAMVDTW